MIMYVSFLTLIVLSAFFSASETSLFSIDKVARNRLHQSTQRLDRVLATMLATPRRLLITILLGNEVTNVALSVVGASITQEALKDLTAPQQALVSALLVVPTLLVIGEITPKTLAAHKSEPVARTLAVPLRIFAFLVFPLVQFLKSFSGLLVRFFSHAEPDNGSTNEVEIAESEFRTLVDAGMREGVVEAQERRMIHNVLDFGELKVTDVMQPWENVVTLRETSSIDEAIDTVVQHQYSRLPMWRNDRSTVTGIVLAKDLLIVKWKLRSAKNLRHLRRTPLFTLADRPAAELLSELKSRRFHMAVVIDTAGKAIGLCTMEDLLEELFGPITDHQASVSLQTEVSE